jgi:hypothetical protein
MKRLSILPAVATAIVVFVGCGAHPDKIALKDSAGFGRIDSSANTDTLSPFQGLWVNKAYADTLVLTRSPRTSQEAGGGLTCLDFPASIREEVHVVWGWHEGGEFRIIHGRTKDSLYDPGGPRTLGAIELISPGKMKLGNQYFVRMTHPDPNKNDYAVIEQLLFAGEYRSESGAVVSLSGRL